MEYNITIDEIYAAISAEDASRLRSYIEQYGEEKAAEEWLNTIPEDQLPRTPFSGGIGEEDVNLTFAQSIRREVDYFICGHPKYQDLRNKIDSKGEGVTLYAATSLAALIGSEFGITTAVILPSVMLLFRIAGRITLNAYCRNYHFQNN